VVDYTLKVTEKLVLVCKSFINLLQPSYVGTTSFNVKKSTFCPQSVFMGFVYLKKNSDFPLYTINCLVFATEVRSVYCAVRTEL